MMKLNMMNRNQFLSMKYKAGVALIAMLLSTSVFADPGKNLLFIITDQQSYDALSIAGNAVLETPNLDRLARQGAYFENAYSACAVAPRPGLPY